MRKACGIFSDTSKNVEPIGFRHFFVQKALLFQILLHIMTSDSYFYFFIIISISMKQFSIILAVMLAMLVSACGGFKSAETPINGTLTAFTAEGKASGDTLIGVKNIQGDIVIEPGDYTSIDADENLIFCNRPNGTVTVCRYDGTDYGTYDTFTRSASENNVFYIAVSGEITTYCFVDAAQIACRRSYLGKNNFFAETDSVWNVYDYTGNKVWSLPQSAMVIESVQTGELIIAVPEKGKHPKCALYTTEGKKIQTLSASRWRNFKKQFSQPSEVGTLRIYRVIPPKYVRLSIAPPVLSADEINQVKCNLYTKKYMEHYLA